MDEERKGVIVKSASLEPLDITDEDMKKINQYTLSPLKPDDVFVFKAAIADTGNDDRNFEPFSDKSLENLKALYPGKTVISDHDRKSENQIARVYDTEIKNSDGLNQLVAKCYMVKTQSNGDLISEINGGIKKEVSTCCAPETAICSICGVDNMKTYCPHYPGSEYKDADGNEKICTFLIDGVKEAYELSFVAVPAQPRAGTCKNFGIEKPKSEPPESGDPKNTEKKALEARLSVTDAFIFAKSKKLENEKELKK